MSRKPPIIFLAHANELNRHLPPLEEEQRKIRNVLANLHDLSYIEFFNLSQATIEDVFTNISRFQDRLTI
jgi:molybdopterin-guanine dinucleotide biosynthesis protein A